MFFVNILSVESAIMRIIEIQIVAFTTNRCSLEHHAIVSAHAKYFSNGWDSWSRTIMIHFVPWMAEITPRTINNYGLDNVMVHWVWSRISWPATTADRTLTAEAAKSLLKQWGGDGGGTNNGFFSYIHHKHQNLAIKNSIFVWRPAAE